MSGFENQKSPDTHAAKPTEPPQREQSEGFVGFVAPSPGHFENLEGTRQETQAGVVSPKSHHYGATKPTETAKRKALPAAVADDELDRQLLDAAMRCCDYWNDGAEARAQMVAEIRATPQHHRQELLEYFQAWYGKPK
jgi:hypothetical protein